jgi:CubicO group peptidase (beta-lactamase class C family)
LEQPVSGGRIDEDTAFAVGSMTKLFTAVLVMRLVDQGAVGLDDAVAKHLPSVSSTEGYRIK